MSDVFDRAREYSAEDVALQMGYKITRHMMVCPFHEDKNASLKFFPDGRYFCFGCLASGNATDFVKGVTGQSDIESAQAVLSLMADSSVRHISPQQKPNRVEPDSPEYDSLCKALQQAMTRLQKAPEGTEAFFQALKNVSDINSQIDNLTERV